MGAYIHILLSFVDLEIPSYMCVCVPIRKTKLNVAKTFKHSEKVLHKEY